MCTYSVLSAVFSIIFPYMGIAFGIIAITKINLNPYLHGRSLAIVGISISAVTSIILTLIIFFAIKSILVIQGASAI